MHDLGERSAGCAQLDPQRLTGAQLDLRAADGGRARPPGPRGPERPDQRLRGTRPLRHQADGLEQEGGARAVDVGTGVVDGHGGQPAGPCRAPGRQLTGVRVPAAPELAEDDPLRVPALVEPGGEAQRGGGLHLLQVDRHLEPARPQRQRRGERRVQGLADPVRRTGTGGAPLEHPVGPAGVDREQLGRLVVGGELHGRHRVPTGRVGCPDRVQQRLRARCPHLQHHRGAGLGAGPLGPVALGDRPRLHPDEEQAGGHGQHRGDPGRAGSAGDAGPAGHPCRAATFHRHGRTPARHPHQDPGSQQPAGHRHHARPEQGHRAGPAATVAHQLHDSRGGEHHDHAVDQAGRAPRAPRRHPAQQLGHRPPEHLPRRQRGRDEPTHHGDQDGEQHRPAEDHLRCPGRTPGRPSRAPPGSPRPCRAARRPAAAGRPPRARTGGSAAR